MTRRGALLALILGTATALGACETPQHTRFPDLTYGHLGTLRLDVARVEIVDEYQPPTAKPNVDHLFPIQPKDALRRWAAERLAASGTPGKYARFVIQDAKVIEIELPRTQGIAGAFTTDQSHRYELTLAAALEIRDEHANFRDAFAMASASRSRTVAENATINEREKVWFELLEAAMNDLNGALERQIRGDLPRYVIQ